MTSALMEWETIDADQMNDIMAGTSAASAEDAAAVRPATRRRAAASGRYRVAPANATAPA